MREKNDEDRQLGTATYLIDKLALRVGNEKGDDEADTVGCCSLRVQHLKLEGDRNITLDFLGKDSMRYFNTVKVDEQVYKNLKDFMHGKKKEDDLFHSINAYLIAGKLNDYLKSNMDDLSAKVFRTYNASITLQQQLDLKKEETDYEGPSDTKIKLYNDANREVAVLCNHQKTVAKNFDAQVIKMQDALKFKKERLKLLNDNMQRVKKNKEPLDYNDEKTGEKKKLPKTVEGTAKLIERLDKTIESEEYKLKSKEDNKQIALNTSKINYMDPRISVAWCKQNEVQIEKVFTKQMRAKFSWAMYIEPDWKF